MKKILVMMHRIPCPPDKGEKIRALWFLKAFKKLGYQVFLACPSDLSPKETVQAIENLKAYCTDIDSPCFSYMTAGMNLLKNFHTEIPLSYLYQYHPQIDKKIKLWQKKHVFEAVFAYSGSSMLYDIKADSPVKILDLVDGDSLKWFSYAEKSCGVMKYLYHLEGRRQHIFEANALKKYHHTLLVTQQEKQDYLQAFPDMTDTAITPLMHPVDLDYFHSYHPCDNPYRQIWQNPDVICVFTGVMNYPPNVEAMVYFCKKILPVWQEKTVLKIKCAIIGQKPSDAIIRLANEHVYISGKVADIRPYLHHATMSINPLLMARGVQNKILEAVACGLPVMASSCAARGTVFIAGQDIFVCDDMQAWQEQGLDFLQDTQKQQKMVQKAWEKLQKNYGFDGFCQSLEKILQDK